MVRSILTAAAALALATPGVAFAWTGAGDDEEFLTIGDKAPKIDIAHWLKGDQIEGFESDKVYVLEFWATWCGPCVASMPHLSKLQEQYKDYDVKVIGVSDEPPQTVVEFLFKEYRDGKIHNERTSYTLTTDPDESVKKAYFKAAGQRGIPCAFIIGKDQHVEWIGHPAEIDDPLESVVKDTWNRAEFRDKWEKSQKAERAMMKRQDDLRAAYSSGDWEKVIEILDDVIEMSGGGGQYQVQKFEIMAKQMGNYDRAYQLAAEIVEEGWDNANRLNQISWFIVDQEGLEVRDLELAMKAAKRANDLTESKNGAILDTVARVYFEKGDLAKALDYQREAVKHASGSMLEQLEDTLQKYEKLAEKGM